MEWICLRSYLFLFVFVCLFVFFTFLSWQVIEVKFNEIKQLVGILGNNEPVDHT